MDITFLMWAVLAVQCFVSFLQERNYQRLHRRHEQLARIAILGLRDLKWAGIQETDDSVIAQEDGFAKDITLRSR